MTTNWTCFFFSFCIAPRSQVGQLMCLLFFMQIFLDFSQRKLDPIITLGVATTHFLTPNVQQGNQVLTKLPPPSFTFVQIFHLTICIFPSSPHTSLNQKNLPTHQSYYTLFNSTPIVFFPFFLNFTRFSFHKRVWGWVYRQKEVQVPLSNPLKVQKIFQG